MTAVVVRFPVILALRQVQLAIHAVHVEGEVQTVTVGQGEQVVGTCVQIAIVAVPQTGIAR